MKLTSGFLHSPTLPTGLITSQSTTTRARPALNYAQNERALCFHGPLIYECKVRQTTDAQAKDHACFVYKHMVVPVLEAEVWPKDHPSGESGPHFRVHYKGWKNSWDEWVPEDRLKKYNEENIRKQKALIEAQRTRDAAEREHQRQTYAAEQEANKRGAAAAAAGGSGGGAAEGAAGAGATNGSGGTSAPSSSTGAATGAVAAGVAPASSGANGAAASSSTAPAAGGRNEAAKQRGQKRTRDGEGEDEYVKRPEIKIVIPDSLKTQLVDDWEAVTKNHTLVPLPRVPNVDTILDEWNKYLQNEDPDRRRYVMLSCRRNPRSPRRTGTDRLPSLRSLAAEVAAGLGMYFNKALGNNLLYKFERGQYAEQLATLPAGRQLSSIYGAEHLLRLFVNLPELLAHTTMDSESALVLKENMAQFLCWLDLNKQILFAKEYTATSSGYQNNHR
ncbi:BQ5605_C015g08008 [Microbotryum silenes-dioicae]|uniref:Chromatin modification-related protein EAF3 n=1 Tax=Microbotryum silenes-dioicae TaxID=796604 RepID=A0A2X0LXE5_9BASI|nr:BQ5605_C015g08008 [Microbotryum silenes-dioicae]